MDELSKNLAENILQLRKARGLTQTSLAKRAQLPRSTLTHMESGTGNPSLKTIHAVAVALDISLEELLAPPRDDCAFIKASDIPVRYRASGLVHVFKLLPDPIPGMEIDRMEIKAGGRFAGTPHLVGTKEYFTCIEGDIQITVAGKTYDLSPGDVVAFPGSYAHSYFNSGNQLAVGISVVVIAPS